MRRFLWIPLLLLITAMPAWSGDSSVLGCMNSYAYRPRDLRLDGSVSMNQREFPANLLDPDSVFHQHLDARWKGDLAMLKAKFKKSGSFKHESDYALALSHNGRADEALEIFERLAIAHPEEYAIAANLGTAYELNGDNRNALNWITKAVELHSDSHEGTEWLHIKILEAKIAMESDSDWLEENTVLGIDFGQGKKPRWPDSIKDSSDEQKRILTALRYQLKERVQFVKPKDPIVAQLLWDLSNVVGLRYSAMNARKVLELAAKYADGDQATRISRRILYYERFLDRSSLGAVRRHPVIFGLLVVTLCILVTVFLGMRMNENRKLSKRSP